MKLFEYLDKYRTPKAAFARQIGISVRTLDKLVDFETDIRLSTAVRIEYLTEKQVTCREMSLPNCLLDLEENSYDKSKKHKKDKKDHD